MDELELLGAGSMSSVDEILRALGRVEGGLEASKAQREEVAKTLETMRSSLNQLRSDVQLHLAQTSEHSRRLSDVETRVAEHTNLLAEVRGISRALKWAWAIVLVVAGGVSWVVNLLLK